jgi:hypothetical protein
MSWGLQQANLPNLVPEKEGLWSTKKPFLLRFVSVTATGMVDGGRFLILADEYEFTAFVASLTYFAVLGHL